MALLLTEQDVADLLAVPDCIQALEEAFKRQDGGDVTNHSRRRLRVPRGILHTMEAADLGLGRMGLKVYTSYASGARFLVLLYDSGTGILLAIIEADRLGQIRTGAATGVATKYLARADAGRLCIIGAGWQAETQVLAVAAVRSLKTIAVFSRSTERRIAFAERLNRKIEAEVLPADSPESAMEGADIIVTATTSRTPVFAGALLAPGAHVNAVGSNSLTRSELDLIAVTRADLVVVDSVEQAKMESGDLLAAIEANRLRWDQVIELREVVSGRRPGRISHESITLFKSNGVAMQDIAAASILFDRAVSENRGRELRLWD